MVWASIAVMLHKQSDKIIVSKLLPIGDVGIYSLLYSMVSKISLITSGVAQALFPFFSKEVNERSNLQYNRMFNLAQEFLVYGILPLFIFISFFAHPILEYVIGQVKASDNYIVVVFLSIYFYLNATMRLIRTYIFGAKDPSIVIKADFLAFFITAPVLFLSVLYFGLKGAAASLILYYIVIGLVMLGKAYLTIFDTNATIWLKQVLGALGFSMITYVPIMYLINLLDSTMILIQLVAFVIATLIYYVTLVKFTSVQFMDIGLLKKRIIKS
jgi:O-antigen/teichoic acid export membrane protein